MCLVWLPKNMLDPLVKRWYVRFNNLPYPLLADACIIMNDNITYPAHFDPGDIRELIFDRIGQVRCRFTDDGNPVHDCVSSFLIS